MLSVQENASRGNTALMKDEENLADETSVEANAVNAVTVDDDVLVHLEKLRKQYGATWDGPDDPENPYNWSSTKKVIIGIVIGLGSLVTLLTASVTAAALGDISQDLDLDAATAQVSFSVYFLGLAFGPFPIAAISETNGRRNIWFISSLWFILWNTLCPVVAAVGASAGNALQAPIMTDMFHEKDRGKSLAIAALFPYLGPALGPIIGGVVSEVVEWPWLFYIVSIVEAVVLVVGLLVLRETYTPVLLRRKAATLSQVVEVDPPTTTQRRTAWNDFFSRLGANMLRPFQLLFYRPIMHVVTLNMGLAFGIYTLVLSTFAQLWVDRYGQSKLTSSLHYISISIGFTLTAQVGGRLMDLVYQRLRERDGAIRGQVRISATVLPGIFLLPAGLFWYGWSAQRHYHWIVVDIGVAIFATGNLIYTQALTAYILDEFREYGASANAAVRVLSQVLGFAFPIFAPKLYDTLDYGWGNTLLAFVFVLLAFPVPACLWLWGERLRAIGRPKTEGK